MMLLLVCFFVLLFKMVFERSPSCLFYFLRMDFVLLHYYQLNLRQLTIIILMLLSRLNLQKKAYQIGFLRLVNLISTRKSHYQLLEIDQNANQEQIRKSFLLKARKCHPDHNDSPQAHQQFKSVKQAYETLKDPQKRFLYDSGLTTQASQEQEIYYNRKSGAAGRKYYENRWYGFQKSNYHDLRDDFYQSRQRRSAYDEYIQKLTIVTVVLVSLFGWEYLSNKNTRVSVQYQHNKHVLQSSIQPAQKQRKRLQKYIQRRSKEHIV